jgi:phytoene synthase
MPLHRRRGQVYIPADMLAAAGLDRETFLEGDDKQRIGIAIEIFATHALDHIEKARRAKISRNVFAAYLPVALSGPVIAASRKAGAGVFEGEVQLSQLRRQWLLAKASFLKRF